MKLSNTLYYRTNHFTTPDDDADILLYKWDISKGQWYSRWTGKYGVWINIFEPIHEYFEITEAEAFIEIL